MVTAVLPIRMASQQRFSTNGTLACSPQATSSSSIAEVLPEPSGKSFGKIRSQLETTLRLATRSKTKPPSPPAEDFATVKVKTDKGKERATSNDEVSKEQKEGGRSRVLKRFESKIGFRSRRESVTRAPSPVPHPNIGKTKDGGGKNAKIQERERVGSGEYASFISPSLRQASTSSPALHLSSQAIPSPKSQSAVPASSSSTASILVSPPRDRTRRLTLQQPPAKDISGPIPLSTKREGRSNGISNRNAHASIDTKEPRTPKRPPPLNSTSSPSLLTSSQPQSPSPSPAPGTPPRRAHERPRTPESPTPQPSRSQHKKAAASVGIIPLKTPPASPTLRTGSPTTRARSPSTRVSPSQRGFTSASTSHLPFGPSPTPPRPPFEAHRRPSVDAPRSSIDAPRRPSVDSQRRPSVDSPRRPSLDAPRRASVDNQRRPLDSPKIPRATSPSTPVRPRARSPNQRANSPSYAQNRHFNMSSSSLALASTPEQRELIRSATSILCREMRKAPPHLSGSQTGLREWQEVEHRLQDLVRAERVWSKSGSILGASPSQLSVSGGAGSSGLSVGGEERERRLFCEALRDGFVLCQLMNKLRPNTITRPDPREDGFTRTSNVTKFLASCSSQDVPSEELFHRNDLIESTPESLARVARTIISVVKVVEFPVVDRSKVLTGQSKRNSGPSDTRSGPYGYGTTSRAASSVPNLLQRSASPTSPTTPSGRKRWSPPSPNLPTVRSVSPSELGSGGSSRTNTTASNKGRSTSVADRPKDVPSPLAVVPPTVLPRSLLRSPSKSKAANSSGDVFSTSKSPTFSPEPMSQMESAPTSIEESSVQRSAADSATRQSMASSTATDVSSLLDVRNKFGTIRTMTTEATSFAPSDMPSYTRTEASSIAASLSEEMGRKRCVGRERRPSEAAVVDLSRVAEERPEDIASRPGSKAGPAVDKGTGKDIHIDEKHAPPSPERVHLGKGKWPDDFLDIFQGQSRPRPIPIKSTGRERQDSSHSHHSPISISPPRKLAIIAASRVNESLESIPRRPSHRARLSVETAVLAPRESILRRDASPDSLPSSGPRVMLRRTSTNQRNGAYIPRTNIESKNDGETRVPFPRAVSGENGSPSPDPSSESQPGPDNDRPHQLRGRFQSDIEGMSSRMRARPSSYDELGNKPRRARIESMVNLGVGSSNASASDLLSRDSFDGIAVRQTLIVREQGKPLTRFQLGNCIGRGQFGSVYRALNLNTGQMVAVKRIRLEGLKEDEVTQLMREVDLVKRLSHPSIVKYEGMARDEDTLSIVLEYVENGSLGQTLKAFGKLNESLVAGYVVKILEGLHYLHQSDVVHCDLKAANILTTKNGNVKLSDFGVSLNLRAMEREMKDVAGTPNWMAPEVIELKGASTKADIWSLGCTVIELLTGRPPYAEIANSMSVMFRIVEDNMPPLPEGVSPLLEDFLKACFHKDPTLRPSAELLCEHEWLKKSWSGLQDLRPQDSIPFLRRVSTDFQKSDALHILSQIDAPDANSPLEGDHPPDVMIAGTPPPPISPRRVSHDRAPPDISSQDSPRDHSFIKTTFSKPMICRVCLLNSKKSAVICESCSLIAHSKCAVNAPPTCDLRAQLLLYAQYAENGNPGSAYSNSVDPLKAGRGHIPTSPMSEVAYVAPSPSSKMSIDIPIAQSPPPHGSPNRPPTAFKFMAAFKTKRPRASLTLESGQVQGSSTSLLPSASDIHRSQNEHKREEKGVLRKPSVLLKRKADSKQRPHSLSSSSTSPNTASTRSAADSVSSRLELGRKSAVSDGSTRSPLSAGESEAPRPPHLMSISGASTNDTEHNDDHSNRLPGGMPLDNTQHEKDSKSGNCTVQ